MLTRSDQIKLEFGKDPDEKEFHAIRSLAVGSYGHLEQAMCRLYFALSGGAHSVSPPVWAKGMAQAAEKFFKMFRSRERLNAIESLLQAKCGNTYSIFWDSLRKHLEESADSRNAIVHWHLSKIMDRHKPYFLLMPPTYWDMGPTKAISVRYLWEFVELCQTLLAYCTALRLLVDPDEVLLTFFKPHLLKPYQELCQKEIVYPIPDDHLLTMDMNAK